MQTRMCVLVLGSVLFLSSPMTSICEAGFIPTLQLEPETGKQKGSFLRADADHKTQNEAALKAGSQERAATKGATKNAEPAV